MSTPPQSIFWEIHSGLPREGPGDDESTRKAFLMAGELPVKARILDIACGPGAQTMELARAGKGAITALDTHQEFLDELERRAREAQCVDRITVINASMRKMPFEEGSFDLIWCEGAMYMMGFKEGLTAWKKFLAPHGYIAVTEPCWLKTGLTDELKAHWAEYPGMTTIENTRQIIADAGFREIGHFVIPDSAWWTGYYTPKERRLNLLREKYRDNTDALVQIGDAQKELDMHRKYHDFYGYVFFVMRREN
jgi:SAM-dependent methyltransferase